LACQLSRARTTGRDKNDLRLEATSHVLEAIKIYWTLKRFVLVL